MGHITPHKVWATCQDRKSGYRLDSPVFNQFVNEAGCYAEIEPDSCLDCVEKTECIQKTIIVLSQEKPHQWEHIYQGKYINKAGPNQAS